jgi:hypothetical protein
LKASAVTADWKDRRGNSTADQVLNAARAANGQMDELESTGFGQAHAGECSIYPAAIPPPPCRTSPAWDAPRTMSRSRPDVAKRLVDMGITATLGGARIIAVPSARLPFSAPGGSQPPAPGRLSTMNEGKYSFILSTSILAITSIASPTPTPTNTRKRSRRLQCGSH